MTPILYDWQAFDQGLYDNNGKGLLADALTCIVTEEINGSFDLLMQYPIKGVHGNEINERDVILAKPNPRIDPEPFRIYRITKPINGVVTVYAHHISYDLCDVPVLPFKAITPEGATRSLMTNMGFTTPFSISAPMDAFKEATMEMSKPMNARAVLMGAQNSIASTFFTDSAGQIYFTWYTVQIMNSRGTDRGFEITYGTNMTDYVKETNRSDYYNGVMPYVLQSDGSIYTLNDRIVMQEPYAFQKVNIVDFTQIMKDKELTDTNLQVAAVQYMRENGYGKYSVSLDASFVNLKDTAEYADIAQLQDVYIGDTVTVNMPMYGSSTKEICSKTVYNVLTDKFNAISLGKLRRGI